jgi:hypothetical protein
MKFLLDSASLDTCCSPDKPVIKGQGVCTLITTLKIWPFGIPHDSLSPILYLTNILRSKCRAYALAKA